jgi:hypothetical protein
MTMRHKGKARHMPEGDIGLRLQPGRLTRKALHASQAVPRMDNLSAISDRLSPKSGSRMATCDPFSCEFKGFLNGTDYASPTRISRLQTSTRWG